jgi:hypothetical protein
VTFLKSVTDFEGSFEHFLKSVTKKCHTVTKVSQASNPHGCHVFWTLCDVFEIFTQLVYR